MPLYGLALGTFFGASASPTPLYRYYQDSFSLSPVVVTLVFAVYAFALLKALLIAGSISDHLGRRPVIFGALLLEIVAMALFVLADGLWLLLAARVVQGVATGIGAASLGAALVDVDRARGQLVNSLAPFIGMAASALATSALVEFAPYPLHLVYGILLAAFAGLAVATWLVPETSATRPGWLRALRPRIAVPARARRQLALVAPINVAAWIFAGFYLSLLPSLIAATTGNGSPITSGAVVAALFGSGAVATIVRRDRAARENLVGGALVATVGTALVVGGIHLASVPVMIAGTLIGGAGFGTSFLGAIGTVMPLANPDDRAGLLSGFYVLSYLAFSLPAIVAGFLVRSLGYGVTADIYGGLIAALFVGGVAAARLGRVADDAEPL